jgi:NADH-quinone oxidoreductase subunit N
MGFALFFMVCMLSAFDLISVYIAMEGLALTLYVLAASDFKVKGSLESSVKYFSLGVIASGVIIFAILLIYLLVGSTNFLKIWYYLGELQNYDNEAYFLGYKLFLKNIELLWNIPLIFLIWGFLFKLAAYPNTMWAPEVYEGSAMPVTAFFAIPVKITFLGVFIRLLYFVFAYLENIWVPLISLAAAGSLVVGCFGALSTDKVKKFLAYASINHMGFMLMGLSSASFKGLSNVWTYLIVYLVMNLVIFAVLLNIRDWKRGTSLVFITDFQYLSANNLFVTVITTIVWFSMAGIPPLAGFFSKYYIFLSAVESSSYFLVFLAIITSIVSTFYYLFFLRSIFFDNSTWSKLSYLRSSNTLFGFIDFTISLFLIFFIFVNSYIYHFFISIAIYSLF